jgi:hypothetical protein
MVHCLVLNAPPHPRREGLQLAGPGGAASATPKTSQMTDAGSDPNDHSKPDLGRPAEVAGEGFA